MQKDLSNLSLADEPTDEELEELLTEELKEALAEMVEPDSSEIWSTSTLRYFGPKSRAILVTGEIDESQANGICSQIQELNLLDAEAPIQVHINTVGGSIVDALAIYDMLMCVPNPIITIVTGNCYSAGLIIACAGEPRLATPNSMYFYHQPTFQMVGIDSMHVMESNSGFYEWCKNNTDKIMRERIGMTEEDWEKRLGHSTSKYFNVETAIDYGFCTATLGYVKKKTVTLEEITESACESSE